MDPNFIFTFGKYKGQTYEFVLENDSDYIDWIMDTCPEKLEGPKVYVPKSNKNKLPPLTPNYGFWEGKIGVFQSREKILPQITRGTNQWGDRTTG